MQNEETKTLPTSDSEVGLLAKLARLKCFFFWHKIPDWTDSGYEFCERCHLHSYWNADFYDGKWNNAGWLVKPIWWLQRKFYDTKYWLKHKYEFWKNDDDGLPF